MIEDLSQEDKDKKYMKDAILEAKKAFKKDEVPIGAVVVSNGRVIGCGHNIRESVNDPTAHAEIMAIKVASSFLKNWRLEDCELYVTVEPCPMCAGAIQQSRIKRLIYGTEDPKAGAVDTLLEILNNDYLNHQTEVTSGVLKEECQELLHKFFKKLRYK